MSTKFEQIDACGHEIEQQHKPIGSVETTVLRVTCGALTAVNYLVTEDFISPFL